MLGISFFFWALNLDFYQSSIYSQPVIANVKYAYLVDIQYSTRLKFKLHSAVIRKGTENEIFITLRF